ncbi:hypothetical protein D3C86_1184180 [compost metagenome]
MAQCLGLGGSLGLFEQFALSGQALGQWQVAGCFNRRHHPLRCALAFPARLIRRAIVGEIARQQGCARVWVRPVRAARAARRLSGNQCCGQCLGRFEQAIRGGCHPIEQPQHLCSMGADRLAGRNKFQRRSGANQTRQTLRTTSAGQQAKFDFRQAQARAGFSHSVAAGHGELQPTAQCQATDGGD